MENENDIKIADTLSSSFYLSDDVWELSKDKIFGSMIRENSLYTTPDRNDNGVLRLSRRVIIQRIVFLKKTCHDQSYT